jgi:chemotaxis signal transduction protein
MTLPQNPTLPFNLGKKRPYILFTRKTSVFAVDLIGVREVLTSKEQAITPVPNTLPFLLGLSNLRGEILAVADFGKFINAEAVDLFAEDTRILIVEAPNPSDVKLPMMRLGLAVSRVEGVVDLEPDEIVSAEEASEELVPFLRGLYNYRGRLVMVLDVEAIANSDRW